MPYIKATYEYTKPRRNFGRQTMFVAGPGQILCSIFPDKNHQNDYILRNPVNQSVQATLPLSEHDTNTKLLKTRDQGMEHVEGGWPRDVHVHNEDHIARYRRRVMHEENYIDAVRTIAPIMKHYVEQNNAIEMYETYFSGMSSQAPVEKCSIKIGNVFRDEFHRPISSVVWTRETNSKLAVAYSYKNPAIIKTEPTDCRIWDVNIQTKPIHLLKPDTSCWQIACSPIDPEIFLCGLENGTVDLFDIRGGEKSVSSTSIYNSHREPISSLLYIHSRSQTEFFTGSPDGQCLWWDTRNLIKPIDQLPISFKLKSGEQPHLGNSEGVSSLNFDHGLPTRFLCGTESGLVINANRMGKEHSEKLTSCWNTHTGPVRAVQRSPCTLRMFLTCGDNSVRVWSEEVHTAPIIVTRPYRYDVMDAAWAPIRYSCYMAICAGGNFYYWDFLRKYKEPVLTFQISKHGLTKLATHCEGHLVAIGDDNGSLHLVHLSEIMSEPAPRDKVLMFQVYSRETHREHILDNRLKEIRLKIKEEEEAATRETKLELEDNETQLQLIEEAYFKTVKTELRNMESFTSSSASLI